MIAQEIHSSPVRIRALKASVKKYSKALEALRSVSTKYDRRTVLKSLSFVAENCTLCDLYYASSESICGGCPVSQMVNDVCCDSTPYARSELSPMYLCAPDGAMEALQGASGLEGARITMLHQAVLYAPKEKEQFDIAYHWFINWVEREWLFLRSVLERELRQG